MSMNGFFVAVPEDKFEEFCKAEDPLDLDYAVRWDVADAWHLIQVVTRMDNHISTTLKDGRDINFGVAADCTYHVFKPNGVQSYYDYLHDMDQLGKIERFRHEPVRIAHKLYHGNSIEGDQLADYILELKNTFKQFAPIQDPDTHVISNRHVVLHYMA